MVLIGNKIKSLRKQFKLTQVELADKLGVTKSTVAAYENDSRLPSYEVLIKISQTFKVSLDSLLLNKPEMTLDVSGLSPAQIETLRILISYLQN